VSLGLVALWLAVGLSMEIGFAAHADRGAAQMRGAVHYALDHPAVRVPPRLLPAIRAVMPAFESNEMFAFLRKANGGEGTRQEEFEVLAAAAFARVDSHPHRSLGLVPALRAPGALATHWLVHSGILHLLTTVLVWLLAAPIVEKLWGKAVFAAAMLLTTLLSAGAFALVHSGAEQALVGAGGMLACAVAALVVRFRAEEVDLLGWLPATLGARLVLPAWALGLLWMAYEGSGWWLVRGAQPAGLDNAVGYVAHALGLLFGGLAALGVRRAGWEQPFGRPVVVAPTQSMERFDFDRVLALRASGESELAFERLDIELRRSARNRDAVTTFWQMCIERGEPERAGEPMYQLIREELRRGAEEVAVAQWRELAEHLPSLRLDVASLFRLVPAVVRVDGEESGVIALQQLLEAGDAALQPTDLVRAAGLAEELSPSLAVHAARRALATGTLGDGPRIELEQLVARCAPPEEGDAAPPVKKREGRSAPPPNVFYEESDRSAFGQVDDLSSLDASFPEGAVFDALPRRVESEGIQLEVAGSGDLALAFSRLRGVAVAGVHGLGPKPVVLIDLIIDGAGSERPLRVLRLRSDRFSPRRFFPRAGGPLDALRRLVQMLLARSDSRPLPDLESAEARPVRVFDSIEEYHESVLRPGAKDWA
jgi:membrane associated rhomboid family serine protease